MLVLHVLSMMMVMMSTASSGALMGLAMTTHAWTPIPTARTPNVQMASVAKGLAALQDIADDVAIKWIERRDPDRTPGYRPSPLRQAIRRLPFAQQPPLQIVDSGETWPPGDRKTWSDSVGQFVTLLQSKRDNPRRYADIPLWEAGMPNQGYGMRPERRPRGRRAILQQLCRDYDMDMYLDDTIDIGYGPGMEYDPGMDQIYGMPQEGYGQMALRQPWHRYPRQRYPERMPTYGDDYPDGMPTYGDDWGVAGPSGFQPRTTQLLGVAGRGSPQALSVVPTGGASMNSFAHSGYDRMR